MAVFFDHIVKEVSLSGKITLLSFLQYSRQTANRQPP
jgi:hypothetical protein